MDVVLFLVAAIILTVSLVFGSGKIVHRLVPVQTPERIPELLEAVPASASQDLLDDKFAPTRDNYLHIKEWSGELPNFITLGHDCSPASALDALKYRNFALPFDWVLSNIDAMEKCLTEDFAGYHQQLEVDSAGIRVKDGYGFLFPHDYPTAEHLESRLLGSDEFAVGESLIASNWMEFVPTVQAKYARRIERFRTITKSKQPMILLCRYKVSEARRIRTLFERLYQMPFIVVNSTDHPTTLDEDYILHGNTERNGNWNDTKVWKEMVDHALELLHTAHQLLAEQSVIA